MKALLIAALAIAGLTAAAPRAQAGHYRCANTYAPYRVNTVEVNRCAYCRTAYDSCGRWFRYTVTVVTYCDVYSDGNTRTYSISYRS